MSATHPTDAAAPATPRAAPADAAAPAAPTRSRTAPARVLVLGGTSEIGCAIVRELAARGGARAVLLAGRDPDALEQTAQGLLRAGCPDVSTLALDASECETHAPLLAQAWRRLGGVDVAILAIGLLGERGAEPADIDIPDALGVLEVNVVGCASLLLHCAELMRAQAGDPANPARGGTLVVLSSVAGERPRASNAVYGASKAGLDALAQGLGDALHGSGLRLLVVRPGFVRTRMTRGRRVPPLACGPEDVARATVRGLERDAQTVWAPRGLRWVMLLLRLLPRPVFRRLGL